MNTPRRAFLAGLGTASLTSLSGCLTTVAGHVRPQSDPKVVPEHLVCEDDGFERHYPGYSASEVQWGNADGFSLRVNRVAFEYGETARITLRYTAIGTDVIGVKGKYNFEKYTQNGWQDVRGSNETQAYIDLGVGKMTGQGWTWNIELTENGIAEATSADVTVCPELSSGRYRFVYWGVDGAVAVAFDIARE